jgi:PAS domain S-box-containing protein
MESSIHILLLEDNIGDAERIREHLEKIRHDCTIIRVDTRDAFKRKISENEFDLILSEYSLRSCDAISILEFVRKTIPDMPFIFVSGTNSIDTTIECMHNGATDFVLKNNLKRLSPAIDRALHQRSIQLKGIATEHRPPAIDSLPTLIIENLPDGILYEDMNHTVMCINKSFREFFNLGTDVSIGMATGSSFIFNTIKTRFTDEASFINGIGKLFDDRVMILGEALDLKDGRIYERDCIPVYLDNRFHGIVWRFRDATEQRRTMEGLRTNEARYRMLFEEDLTGDFITDTEGVITSCNPRFVSIFGFSSPDEAIGYDYYSLYPDTATRNIIKYKIRKNQRVDYAEQVMQRRDGSPIHVVATLSVHTDENNRSEIRGYIFDDTLRKKIEQHLLQSHKLESISTLAGGIAHDFNNILGIILGHTSLMERKLNEPENLRKSTETIAEAVKRGASLVQQLLTFARKSRVQMDIVSLHDIVSDMHALLQDIFPKTIEISVVMDPQVPSIIGDRSQLHQALLNLCINARDAMPQGGTLTISTRLVTRDDIDTIFGHAKEDSYVYVSVTDTGMGMDASLQSRIFEPFFTTRETGKGTGLGLSLVYGVVTGHNGFVDVTSDLGRGTTIYLYFPVHHIEKSIHTILTRENKDVEGGNETILLVEDEHALLEIVTDFLTDKGYRVITARDGIEAVELYKKHEEGIDVIISDLGLPRLGGLETTQRIREINPHVKCILASGFLDSDELDQIRGSGISHIIEKPYNPVELLLKLKEVLATNNHTGTTAS